jgi:hypothetical protein
MRKVNILNKDLIGEKITNGCGKWLIPRICSMGIGLDRGDIAEAEVIVKGFD